VGARPSGESLQPGAIGAVMEVTNWLKPSNGGHELVTARVCRPLRSGNSRASLEKVDVQADPTAESGKLIGRVI
jgi:hypothetical protein